MWSRLQPSASKSVPASCWKPPPHPCQLSTTCEEHWDLSASLAHAEKTNTWSLAAGPGATVYAGECWGTAARCWWEEHRGRVHSCRGSASHCGWGWGCNCAVLEANALPSCPLSDTQQQRQCVACDRSSVAVCWWHEQMSCFLPCTTGQGRMGSGGQWRPGGWWMLPKTIWNPTKCQTMLQTRDKNNLGKCYVWKSSQISLLWAFQNL